MQTAPTLRHVATGAGLLAGALALAAPAPAAAQPPAPSTNVATPAVEIILRPVSAFPGGDLTVPLEIKVKAGAPAEVRRITFTVRVPDDLVFRRVALAWSQEQAEGRIEAASAPPGADGSVRVTVTAGDAPLTGVVGYLVFAVPPRAPYGTRELRVRDARAASRDEREIRPVAVAAAAVSVVDPKSVPIIACFFYMH